MYVFVLRFDKLPLLLPRCRNVGGTVWPAGCKTDLVDEFVQESVESTIISSLNLISVIRLVASRILLPQAGFSFFRDIDELPNPARITGDNFQSPEISKQVKRK